jgi:hypothetical protein
MKGRVLCFLVPFLLLPLGCPSADSRTSLVPSDPFDHSPPAEAVTRTSYAQASLETAARVDSTGRKILATNPQLGIQPLFRTIGAPQPEIFHRGTFEVDVTEGLANQCITEGQLAAVLCQELGKMIAEREALAGPQARKPQGLPPLEVPVGSDNAGSFGPADQMHRAELAAYDKERRQRAAAATPPDPQALARTYLTKAGYPPGELDAAKPLLAAAAENRTFTRQIVPASTPPAPVR